MSARLGASILAALLLAVGCGPLRVGPRGPYDVVLRHGRVVDPESGLDAVRNLGIRDGRIAAISAVPLDGRETLDVAGLVVAPGFIDLHAHGQDERSARLQAHDGVTTALDMEVGVFPVAEWYASREGKAPINFGAAVGHIPARIKLKQGVDVGHRPTDHRYEELVAREHAWSHDAATPDEIDRLVGLLERGLSEGAPGIGVALVYTPGAGRDEVYRIFQLAARRHAVVFVHLRSHGEIEPASSTAAIQEVVADAAASGASLHLVHITSSALRQTPLALEMIADARRARMDVTVEAYPYTAASTWLSSAFFDAGWEQRYAISYHDLQWSATGERLTKEAFEKYRKQPGWVIAHMIPEPIVDLAITNPMVMIASDGIPFATGGEHPRGAGTFSRVLGHYVREQKRLTLVDALRKMTLMPAQRLENRAPQMRSKGRLRVGADADVTVFDPDRVADRATYEKPMQPSAGIVHVLVNGVFVVRDGETVAGAFPGRPIRRAPAE